MADALLIEFNYPAVSLSCFDPAYPVVGSGTWCNLTNFDLLNSLIITVLHGQMKGRRVFTKKRRRHHMRKFRAYKTIAAFLLVCLLMLAVSPMSEAQTRRYHNPEGGKRKAAKRIGVGAAIGAGAGALIGGGKGAAIGAGLGAGGGTAYHYHKKSKARRRYRY